MIMMKKHIKITTLWVACMLIFSECDDKLDLAPLGELNSETFYNNEEDFEAASLAPYSTLQNLYFDQNGRGWFSGIMYPSDDVRNPQGNNNNEEFIWLPNNGDYGFLWDTAYKGIMRANVVIERLAEAEDFSDEANKARFEAEARFIRAYFNFILARNFGNAPVVESVISTIEETRVANSQPGEIWDLIESDLDFAVNNLPDTYNAENTGRATRYAALALLGKVELFRAQWFGNDAKYGEAVEHFNELVNSGQYVLVDDFGANFSEDAENNQESIFEIQMTRGDFNPWLPNDFGLAGNQNVGAAGTGRKIFTGAGCFNGECAPGGNVDGYGRVHITSSLREEFEENDPRIFHTYYREGEDYAGEPYDPAWSITGATPAKYLRPFTTGGFPPNISTNNERVIRYSDVLLMLAEAELLGNGNVARAAELINQVRERARNNYEIIYEESAPDDLLSDRPTDVSVDQMHEWLRHERRVELALEVHRYDDLVRWHRAGIINIPTDVDFGNTLANQNWAEIHLLKPIPQRELDNNPNLEQNPGY
jgi:hypothetical protein